VSTITYGTSVPDETELRLCGDVHAKRVVELGLGPTANAVVFAERGAKAMAVDPSADRVTAARRQAEEAEVRVEFHQGELADLGFATSASVDLVFSSGGAVAAVDDLSRLFRQVHRVLRPGSTFVFSMPHPIAAMLEGGEVVLRKPYWTTGTRTVSDVFMALSRANFQVDVLVEPPPTDHPNALVPAALVVRARKLGV
jgi:SAM-dependent methyltransferase